jgi:hypothetical protein
LSPNILLSTLFPNALMSVVCLMSETKFHTRTKVAFIYLSQNVICNRHENHGTANRNISQICNLLQFQLLCNCFAFYRKCQTVYSSHRNLHNRPTMNIIVVPLYLQLSLSTRFRPPYKSVSVCSHCNIGPHYFKQGDYKKCSRILLSQISSSKKPYGREGCI